MPDKKISDLTSGSAIGGTEELPIVQGSTTVKTTINAIKAYFNTVYESLVNKDATGGYVGLTLFKINFKNAANTFTSFFTNTNTASRTYTFQDRNGTIADNTDLATKADKNNTVLTSYLEVPEQSKPSTPTNAFRLYADTSNRLSWIGENGYVRTFDGTSNTADRVYTLPNVAGSIMVGANNLSDLANPLTARNNLKIWDFFLTGGDQSTTSNVATNITDLVSPTLTASKRYRIHGVIKVGCNNTGGIRFQITLPSGASMDISLSGSNTSNTAYINATITSSATLSAQVQSFNGLSMLRVDGEISLGVTAGTIQFGFASGINTQTSTVYQLGTQLTLTQIN